MLSLFFVPIFYHPQFINSFTQGKELLFKSICLITVIFLGLSLFRKKYKYNDISSSNLLFLLLLQIAVFAFTDALSATPVAALHGTYSRGFGFIIEMFLMFFLIYCGLFLSRKNIGAVLKISFISGFVVAVYAILQKLGFDPLFTDFGSRIFSGRVFSFSGNPSYLGQIMLIYTIIGTYLVTIEKNKYIKYFYITGTALALLALIFSETRAAFLGLLITATLVLIKYRKTFFDFLWRRKVIATVFLLISAVSLISFLPGDRFSFSKTAFRSLNSRYEIWNGTLDLIAEKPLFGYGGDTFYIYFPEIITKKFLELEENIEISADRIHNETLDIFFSHGIFAFLIYLAIALFILHTFFTTKNRIVALLSLIIVANIMQNQFAFPDISISIIIAFAFGAIVAMNSSIEKESLQPSKSRAVILFLALLFITFVIGKNTVVNPYLSQLAYTKSKNSYSNYEVAVTEHKKALNYTPYYSELWFELIFIDRSSLPRALAYIEKIEGESGTVLAWKGNLFASENPSLASEYYLQALNKNPNNPSWIRAFGDMLYDNGDYENALYLYSKYIDAIPDFWQKANNLDDYDRTEKKTYETFLKHSPYFWGTIEKIEKINSLLENSK